MAGSRRGKHLGNRRRGKGTPEQKKRAANQARENLNNIVSSVTGSRENHSSGSNRQYSRSTTVRNGNPGNYGSSRRTRTAAPTVKRNTEQNSNVGNSRRITQPTNKRRGSRHDIQTGNPRRQLSDEAGKNLDKSAVGQIDEVGRRLPGLTAGAVQQSMGSLGKAMPGTVSNIMRTENKKGTGGIAARHGRTGVSRKGSNDRRTIQQKQEQQEVRKENAEYSTRIRRQQKKNAQIESERASKLIDKGTERIEKEKKGLSKGGKWLSDLYVGGVQLAGDAAIGAATGGSALPAMFLRSYGGSMDSAEKEGASGDQAVLYGVSMAALETATEKMFSITKPLNKIYGKGAGDELTEKVLSKMMGKATKQGAKDALYHGGKTFFSALTEGLEEMVSEGLEPAIANQIYAEALGTPHSTSAKDVLYAGSIGAALGGVLGGGGQIIEYSQGKNISDNATELFGKGGINELIKEGLSIDEDTGGNTKAAAYQKMIKSGNGIAMGQTNELAKEVQQQRMRDYQNYLMASRAADNTIKKEGYAPVTSLKSESGLAENTEQVYTESIKRNTETINKMQLPEIDVEQTAEKVARIQTGVADVSDINSFTLNNPEERTAYESITGTKLPQTNKDTKIYLMDMIGQNRISQAKAETEWFRDAFKGIVQKEDSPNYNAVGQEALGRAIENVKVGNPLELETFRSAFKNFYNAGRANMDLQEVKQITKDVFDSIPLEVRESAFKAGMQDKIFDEGMALNMQMRIRQTGKEMRSQGKNKAHRGRLVNEVSNENAKYFGAEQQSFYRRLARIFGIEIHIVDDSEVNGTYKDGVVTISINADRGLKYVFAHEITHHMQTYAPEQYQKLKQLVREKWTEKGGIQEAVEAKQAQYKLQNVNINYEEALDEILADSTYEMIQDESFVEERCSKDRNIAQSILNAIKSVISKIRAAIAEGQGFSPKQNAKLLSELGILKDAEKLWADGLMEAARNKDAVGRVEFNEELSFSIKEDMTDLQRYEKLKGEKISIFSYNVKNLESNIDNLDDFRKNRMKEVVPNVRNLAQKLGILGNYSNDSIKIDFNYGNNNLRESLNKQNWILGGDRFVNFAKMLSCFESVIDNAKLIEVHRDDEGHNEAPNFLRAYVLVSGYLDGKDIVPVKLLVKEFDRMDNVLYVSITLEKIKEAKLYRQRTSKKHNSQGSTSIEISLADLLSKINDDALKKYIPGQFYKKFSLKDPVEETKDLIALHNIAEDNLIKTLKLGGFPMPSIAVTKDNIGHNKFGPISVMFSKDTIDPANRKNKVYSADAWTPTFPRIEYELNYDKASEIYSRANELGRVPFFNPVDLAPQNLEDKGSEQDIIERFKSDYGMKQMYISDNGGKPVELKKKTVRTEMSDEQKEISQFILDNFPAELIDEAKNPVPFPQRKKWLAEHKPELEEVYGNYFREEGIDDETISDLLKAMKPFKYWGLIKDAVKFKENGGITEQVEDDYEGTKKEIDEKVNQEKYKTWLKELFSGIISKSGVWNGEDSYTYSEESKPFEDIHYPVTVDNIVQAMLDQADDERNSESVFAGTKTVRAVTAKSFESIDDIKNESDKLKDIDTEEYAEIKDELDNRLSKVMSEIVGATKRSDNQFIDGDILGAAIAEACTNPTPENFKSVLSGYKWKVTDNQVQELSDIANDVMDMPVNMFEAKPQRVVGFDEIEAVVLPENTSDELKTALDEKEISYVMYNGTEEDRLEKVNETADGKKIKFSIKDDFIDDTGKKYDQIVVLDRDIFKRKKNRAKALKEFVYNELAGHQFIAHDEDNNSVTIEFAKTNERVKKDGAKNSHKVIDKLAEKRGARNGYIVSHTDELIEVSKPDMQAHNDENSHQWLDENGWDYRVVYMLIPDGEIIEATLNIGNTRDGRKVLYDINKIKTVGHGVVASKGSHINPNGEYSISEDKIERKYSFKDSTEPPTEEEIYDYMDEYPEKFGDILGQRDYEIKQKKVRQASYEELRNKYEKLKKKTKLTHGREIDRQAASEECNNLIKTLMTYSESYTPKGGKRKTNHKLVELATNNVAKMFRAYKNGDFVELLNTARLTAQEIVENLEFVDDAVFVTYKKMRDYMRTTRLTVPSEVKVNIVDYSDWRKKQLGRFRLVNDGDMSIEQMYSELCELYPGMFTPDILNPADQLLEMADVRESLEPYDIMLSAEESEQLIKQIEEDLLDIAVKGKPWKSWRDKLKEEYEKKLKLEKTRHQEAIADIRRKAREQADKRVNQEKYKGKERLDKTKLRGEQKLQQEKEKNKAKEAKRKEEKTRKATMASIEMNRRWLADRILKPTDDKHIPEGFKSAVADILSQIDMQSKKSKKFEEKRGERAKRWVEMDELRARFAEIAMEDGSGEFEYDGYVFDIMKSLAEKMDGHSVDEATIQQLIEIDILLKNIVINIRNYNKAFSEELKEGVDELANETYQKCQKRIGRLKSGKHYDRSGPIGAIDSLLNESMVAPRDFFELLGGGMQKSFMALRHGMNKHVDNISQTRAFFESVFKGYSNKKKPGSKVEGWRHEKEAREFSVQGGKIKLNTAQIMSLYCLSKRDQAVGHLLGSGIVASRVDTKSKIKKIFGAKIEEGSATTTISAADLEKIISSLTDEQKAMADKLQGYLNNECAEWGNEVSMKLFGYRKFTEENYFPIKSADAYLDSNFEGRENAERIKNFGFTKGTVVNANNPIMIDDIFTVVADHINKMSLYNAYAAPISDFMRVYNHKTRNEDGFLDGSVQEALKKAYGKKAINYINNFMADLNNQTQTRTEGLTRIINRSLANYKKSAIGANLRVGLQQPTAVIRAFTVINPKYFANSNMNIKKNLKDMKEHCQIARWKSWGFSQVDMANDIDDIMMNKEWNKIDLVTMQLYGYLDNLTWSTIWAAVRKETAKKHPNIKVDSEEFYQICNERASEIFDKTQVVDSVFHRSQVMRNTDSMSKVMTSFMAEPTRTYNMVRTEYAFAREAWKEGNKKEAIGRFNKATTVFVLNAAAVSAAAAIADALREGAPGDDDDDDSWIANFWNNFWGNVNPFNMIPLVKDIWGFADGWGSSNMALEGYEKLVESVKNLAAADDKVEAFKGFCEGLGYVTGLPVKNVLRESNTIFKLLGIDVFATDGSEEKKEEKGFIDKAIESLKEQFNIEGEPEGASGHELSDEEYYGIYADSGKGLWDRITDKSSAKIREEQRADRVDKILSESNGDEDKIWSKVTKNYTNFIEDGDFSVIKEMRKTLEACGGDVEKFDESVISKTKTAFKKTIGNSDELNKQQRYKAYLIESGLTVNSISSEIITKSDTAKEFQISLCTNDDAVMMEKLGDLMNAGLTYNDYLSLYESRHKAIKASDYSSGEMLMPVTGEITSYFGYRSSGSTNGIGSTDHKGLDIGVPMDSDVAAADGGKVVEAGWYGGYGNYVEIDHGNGRRTVYGHLDGYYVQKGDIVSKGDVIALSGSTGNSTGPHLHFGVKENNKFVDPMMYFN